VNKVIGIVFLEVTCVLFLNLSQQRAIVVR